MPTTKTKSAADLSITRTATQEDAQLLVQLMGTPIATRASDGTDILFTYGTPPTYEQFRKDHPHGSEGARAVNAVLTLNETIGTFVKNGLLDRDLVEDLLWVQGSWNQCKNIALHYRTQAGEPRLYENFEWLATSRKA